MWDPLRKKEVASTPEESVRQWFISVLRTQCGVPEHMMSSEVPFTLGDKQFRSDIVVWGRDLAPRVLVECKRPDVALTPKVLQQAVDYNRVLNVPYIIITNGTKVYALSRDEGGNYGFIDNLPDYDSIK